MTVEPRSRRAGGVLLVAVLLLGWLLTGCGVPAQSIPEAVSQPKEPPARSAPPEGSLSVTVYLSDGARLVPVQRPTSETRLRSMLVLLTLGPTTAESEAGLRTALVAGSLHPTMLERGPRVRGQVAEVAVTDRFTGIAGDDQLLATAQLVWTLTGSSPARFVRVVANGDRIELPTDEGLTEGLVTRDDYRSVAPSTGAISSGLTLRWLIDGGQRPAQSAPLLGG